MKLLKIASCMAENTEPFCRALARYIQIKIGMDTEYVGGIAWQERERMFDAGEIQVLWLCGLPYVRKAELLRAQMELMAVPVPIGRRYENRPVYFPMSSYIDKAPIDVFPISADGFGLSTNQDLIPVTMSFELIWRV